jgi:hypothetical protein
MIKAFQPLATTGIGTVPFVDVADTLDLVAGPARIFPIGRK